MGKNQQHKKKLKEEKSKVHIKSKTKFLPKGLNVTKTDFKVKAIILPDQQKLIQQRDKNLKKNVNELTARLKHFNSNNKVDAVHDLVGLVHHVDFKINLSQILQNTCTLIQDREKKVRNSCVKLITEILKNSSVEEIRPFFHFLSTNLRCAMTNIDKTIQSDSLLMLDCILNYTPGLIGENYDKIFTDFLGLISTTNANKVLTLNKKLTTLEWRVKIFNRLFKILQIIISKPKTENPPSSFEIENRYFIPLIDNTRADKLQKGCFDSRRKTTNNEDILLKHVTNFTPLLYEAAMEIVPEKKLSDDAKVLLNVLTEILLLLGVFMEENEKKQILPMVFKAVKLLLETFGKLKNPGPNLEKLKFYYYNNKAK